MNNNIQNFKTDLKNFAKEQKSESLTSNDIYTKLINEVIIVLEKNSNKILKEFLDSPYLKNKITHVLNNIEIFTTDLTDRKKEQESELLAPKDTYTIVSDFLLISILGYMVFYFNNEMVNLLIMLGLVAEDIAAGICLVKLRIYLQDLNIHYLNLKKKVIFFKT